MKLLIVVVILLISAACHSAPRRNSSRTIEDSYFQCRVAGPGEDLGGEISQVPCRRDDGAMFYPLYSRGGLDNLAEGQLAIVRVHIMLSQKREDVIFFGAPAYILVKRK